MDLSACYSEEQKDFLRGMLKNFPQDDDSDVHLERLVDYVQSIPYEFRENPSVFDIPRTPKQTIIDNTGICTDKSILLGALLEIEGYAYALLYFESDNHMCVGIPSPKGCDYKGCGYAVIECTNHSYIGGFPIDLHGNHDLKKPIVIKIGNGTKMYSVLKKVIKIHKMMEILEKKLEDMRKDCVYSSPQKYLRFKNFEEILRFIKRKIPYGKSMISFL